MSVLCKCSAFYLSEELIEEILKRLPAKSLLKFMSVCKSWYSLINCPIFISTHLDHQLTEAPKYVLYRELDSNSRYFVHCGYDGFDGHKELEFTEKFPLSKVDSCDGIFCLGDIFAPRALLWNPSTGKCLDIVAPYSPPPSTRYSYGFGFGFDATANDYKVVVVVKYLSSNYDDDGRETVIGLHVFFVYSLTAGTWKCSDFPVELEGDCNINLQGVHLNGVVYWLLRRFSENHKGLDSVLTYNLENQTIEEVPLPRAMVNGLDLFDKVEVVAMMLERSTRKLDVVLLHTRPGFINLWVLEGEGTKKSWRKVLSADVYYKRVVNVRTNGDIILELEDDCMISLSPKSMTMKHIQCDQRLYYMGTYVESLLLLEQCRTTTKRRRGVKVGKTKSSSERD